MSPGKKNFMSDSQVVKFSGAFVERCISYKGQVGGKARAP